MSQTDIASLLALDVGAKRIGVAVARTDVRFAQPLTTLEHTPAVFQSISALIEVHNASTIVVGLPRGLDGQVTTQTKIVEAFADELAHQTDTSIVFQDEAVTSVQAEAELAARKQTRYTKADVDALAATYILEDYLREHV